MIFVLVIIFLLDFLNVYVGIFPLSRTLPNSGKSTNEMKKYSDWVSFQ